MSCGIECNDYAIASGGVAQLKGVMEDIKLPKNFTDIASKAAPGLSEFKERSVLAPAIVFALTAVAVGLILSFIVDRLIAQQIEETMHGLMYEMLGPFASRGAFSNVDFGLGTVTVWLLTCLGGLSMSVRADLYGDAARINAGMSLGLVVLLIVPAIALLAARFARGAFIDNKHPDKRLNIKDGILGAGIFTCANLIISFFPSSLGNNLKQIMRYQAGDGRISVSVGPQLLNLLIFSFIVAFIFSMPSYKSMMEMVSKYNKASGSALAVVTRYIRMMLLSSLIMAGVILIYFLIRFNSEIDFNDLSLTGILTGLPNLAIWLMSFLTLGKFTFDGQMLGSGSGSMSAGITGIQLTEYSQSMELLSWFGFLLPIAGLWIATTAMYKLLRDEDETNVLIKGFSAAGLSAVAMWMVSYCASFAINLRMSHGRETERIVMTIGTASFMNFLLCAVIVAIAAAIVYATKKSREFDNIVLMLAKPWIAYAVTAAATLILCLTASSDLADLWRYF
jgi:hypothetical protein